MKLFKLEHGIGFALRSEIREASEAEKADEVLYMLSDEVETEIELLEIEAKAEREVAEVRIAALESMVDLLERKLAGSSDA